MLESQFTIQVIRKTTPEAVKLNIFARINTGGVPLSPQELRHALTPGPASGLLRDLAGSEALSDAVAHSVSPTRMADREMVLRYLAFRLEDPLTYRNQDFDDFLRTTMKRINAWNRETSNRWQSEFIATMRASERIFGDDAFRKRYSAKDPRRPVSKALFEAVAVAIASLAESRGGDPLERLVARSSDVRERFIALMADREFDRSVSQGTGDPRSVRYRFRRTIELMNDAGG